jgi:phosphate transport system permease protein
METHDTAAALSAALKGRSRTRVLGLTFDDVVRYFFGGNAAVAVVVLLLILIFLLKEGAGFFEMNVSNLNVYRRAGLEYVDLMRRPVDQFAVLTRGINDARLARFKALLASGKDVEAANEALKEFDTFADAFGAAAGDARGIVSDLTEVVSAVKVRAQVSADKELEREMLRHAGRTDEAAAVKVDTVDFTKEIKVLVEASAGWKAAASAFESAIRKSTAEARGAAWAKGDLLLASTLDKAEIFLKSLPEVEKQMAAWRFDEPVPLHRSFTGFLFGREWLTASFWQDWYGLLPLLSGSLVVSVIAMLFAVPLAISAAIYVSEVASPKEKAVIKPYIEFISAIPSVVLGFFGVAILGTALRSLSEVGWLRWVPGFPMSERLNALTAGLLLALVSIPTIFSLAEDALTNVPKHFKEASFALGATRYQTLVRVLVPAALSGIISAVLLGFGRVIGETMVVLLCAGNRIAIPDFTQGLGAFFQPVHTMTGIIAQEMGEVAQGSIHYRALFMVGIFLFLISLVINYIAQRVVRRYRISIG